MEQLFIDRFIVPPAAKAEFMERMAINRTMINKLPGFIRDEAFVREDEQGQLHCITIAVWESESALKAAKGTVQAEYQRQGFNLPAMLERLDIRMERGQFQKLEDLKS
ncbi:antibiotic biosynthesis monooxygenase family protein [Mucilaginibacter ginsenosidivorax]|uniref:Antibiotic biosynthesis monooxygenase n=1 Tax=Mucilaginibacter ginsenosidivorax TaxID=862126 RepID=A0A5B8VVK4_9SPHI|nr:antibiotic biosynthesis monooxygenase [Mucilaginibacter ginsenosidivorax]QEC74635.1 antibiotic biosynthesis monooxygenase [Mucilaginibacter ginsenosidivorax]